MKMSFRELLEKWGRFLFCKVQLSPVSTKVAAIYKKI
jgi:hypothetical protein